MKDCLIHWNERKTEWLISQFSSIFTSDLDLFSIFSWRIQDKQHPTERNVSRRILSMKFRWFNAINLQREKFLPKNLGQFSFFSKQKKSTKKQKLKYFQWIRCSQTICEIAENISRIPAPLKNKTKWKINISDILFPFLPDWALVWKKIQRKLTEFGNDKTSCNSVELNDSKKYAGRKENFYQQLRWKTNKKIGRREIFLLINTFDLKENSEKLFDNL